MKFRKVYWVVLAFSIFLSGCNKHHIEEGVSYNLAKNRKEAIANVTYNLFFSFSENKAEDLPARAEIAFDLNKKEDVILDFRNQNKNLLSVTANNRQVNTSVKNGHIIIPSSFLQNGANQIDVEFQANSQSLNRKDNFLYTLLVPDRAQTVFPCFDQPDLKASFKLSLEIPLNWVAVSNAPASMILEIDSKKVIRFCETKPISTYLFAFAAGQFNAVTRTVNGSNLTVYYRETNKTKVNNNLDAIYESEAHSLNWLSEYTGIPYPFSKLDVVLIPDFQYGGMEHPGAIFYRESRILLNENPSETELLNRANLIAHETSHQWFGDLVTMRWFNDVWLKEVFASLMADKIVNPQFPNINHELSFILSHYPSAYSVDRTAGTNPIRQKLDNLLLAGTLYGDIIYNKAPIALNQLELSIGQENLRKGLQLYLKKYSMSNADWNDLIAIFDSLSPASNLFLWNKCWIEKTGMPTITEKNRNGNLVLEQSGNFMPMMYDVGLVKSETMLPFLNVNQDRPKYSQDISNKKLTIIFPNSNGMGYGMFVPDSTSLTYLTDSIFYIENPISRAACYINFHELFLNNYITKDQYISFLQKALDYETEPQITDYLLGNVKTLWWRFFNQDYRNKYASGLELLLWNKINSSSTSSSERKPFLNTFSNIATSPEALKLMTSIWQQKTKIPDVTFSENELVSLSYQIAIRSEKTADSILNIQQKQISNPDLLAKFSFVRRALSYNENTRNAFFQSLKDAKNRRPEPWVTEALYYFNHPIHENFSINYLKASLDLLPEIQQTGDIFFPKSWLDATLWGHNTKKAETIVKEWIKEHPNLSDNLKRKLLQSADILFRSQKVS